jgi:hypothetical protein
LLSKLSLITKNPRFIGFDNWYDSFFNKKFKKDIKELPKFVEEQIDTKPQSLLNFTCAEKNSVWLGNQFCQRCENISPHGLL